VTIGVVRVGDTVRKPPLGRTPYVVQLLRHFERVGFEGAPRFLGYDERGRLILTYVEGDVPANIDGGDAPDTQLRAVARLIRRFHDATAGTAVAGDREVACHHDLSPVNTVYREGVPVAFIDWDGAAPGRRIDDVARAAWLFLDLAAEGVEVAEQARRLALFADAYGVEPGTDLAGAVVECVRSTLVAIEEGLAERSPHVDREFLEHARSWSLGQLEWLERNATALRGD
jgi:aminoglycoside phosphotransferase (APT) family kinase protein